MRRPVLWVLFALICGIISRMYGSLLLMSLSFMLGLFLCIVLYRIYKYAPVFIFLLFFLLGIWRMGHSLNVPDLPTPLYSHFSHENDHTTIYETSQNNENEYNYIETTTYLHRIVGTVIDTGITGGANQRVTIHEENGLRIMAYIRPYQPWASIGQEITLIGELQPLRHPANPVGYNQFLHLRTQKIDAIIWPDIIILGEVNTTFMVLLSQFSDRLAYIYEQVLPPTEARIMQSMVLGDRSELDTSLIEIYRVAGIFHILVISGLHIAILIMLANKVLGLLLDERHAGIIVLVVMILYCLLTGASVSTVRAVTMAGILIFSKVLDRDYDLLASVSVACVALLIFEPLYLYTIGFQLSFGAVYGIAILTKPFDRLFSLLGIRPMGQVRNGFSVGVAATVSTYVVFMYHFYEIQLYSIPGNLIIMPTSTLLLTLGVLIGIIGLVWLPLAELLAGAVYFILRQYEMGATFVSYLPFNTVLTGGGSVIVAGLAVLVLVVFAYTLHGFGSDLWKRSVLLLLTILVLVLTVTIQRNPRSIRTTELYTFGEYSVVRYRRDVFVIGRVHGGEGIVLQYLDMHGVSRATGLILTEFPQIQDVSRLAQLARRIDRLYLPYGLTEIELSLTIATLAELENRYGLVFLEVI